MNEEKENKDRLCLGIEPTKDNNYNIYLDGSYLMTVAADGRPLNIKIEAEEENDEQGF